MVTILIPRALLGARLHGYRISRSLPFILKSIQFSVIPASAIASNNVTLQKGIWRRQFFFSQAYTFVVSSLVAFKIRAWVMRGVTLQTKVKEC